MKCQHPKGQDIRLLDVFFVGPIMMYGGLKSDLPPAARIALTLFGFGTIAYNGLNYLSIRGKRFKRIART